MPAFETPDLLRTCLRSIARQEAVELEIIVSDNSRSSVARDLIEADESFAKQVRYFDGARTGNPVDNWNHGLAAATAPLQVVIHHDEYFVDPLYLRAAVDALAAPRVAAAIGRTEVIGVDRPSGFARAGRLARLLGRPAWLLPSLNWIGPTAAFVFRAGHRFDPSFVQLADVAFYRRVLASGRAAYIERRCVGSRGHHPDQITARIDPAALALAEMPRLCGGAELKGHEALLRLRAAFA